MCLALAWSKLLDGDFCLDTLPVLQISAMDADTPLPIFLSFLLLKAIFGVNNEKRYQALPTCTTSMFMVWLSLGTRLVLEYITNL